MIYFQDSEETSDSLAITNFTPTFKVDDILDIKVLADDPQTTVPFNLPSVSAGQTPGYSNGIPVQNGYLIDETGQINMPVIGKIEIAGKTRVEAVQEIESKLNDYLKNPVVNIRIQNFKITVLGDVSSPGTYLIPNERITLLEAIGLAGDLRSTGVRQTVKVIRDTDGVKQQYVLDLTTTEVFNSPCYYLQQNDVVYVEPNATSRYRSTLIPSIAPVVISVTSLLISTITLILR